MFPAHPDLVVVEFAVNDAGRDSVADMERIVRKTWTVNSRTDILFIYTVARNDLALFSKGRLPPAVDQHETVATHYGIPSIIFGRALAKSLGSGQLRWEDFSTDECHPTRAGYELYNKLLGEALAALLTSNTSYAHQLKAPLRPAADLYPPLIVPQPLTEEPALIAADGRVARCTYRLPIV